MKSGFFNSVGGDRKYDADDISNYFLKLISNGVFATPADSLQVQANGGMSVKVTPGWAFVNCKWLRLDTDYVLELEKSDVQYNRLDRIVVRLDPSDSVRSVTIAVKKGTASSPTKIVPLTREKNGVWELSLAQVWVFANSTEIKQSAIVDERANTDVCGWVTGLIDQIDTTNLFAQYDAAFNEFMENLRNGTADIPNNSGSNIRTSLTNFARMVLGYKCDTIANWEHFPGTLNGYGVSNESFDINAGDKLLVWWNGNLLMEKEDYLLTRGGYTDELWHIVPCSQDKYVGGQLTIQVWYKANSDEDNANQNNVAAISGSASNELYGSSTETIIDECSSVATGSVDTNKSNSVKTVSGKSEKLED